MASWLLWGCTLPPPGVLAPPTPATDHDTADAAHADEQRILGTVAFAGRVVRWVLDDAGLVVSVEGDSGRGSQLGLAYILSDRGWFGEDCYAGTPDRLPICHPLRDGVLALAAVGHPDDVESGRTTRFDVDWAEDATFAWFDPDACFTWGAHPEYYGPHGTGCELVE